MNQERMMKILLEPRITEKSTLVGDKFNQYVFKVVADANKSEIKQAVEKLFEVEVESVQVMNMQGKRKRFSQIQGKRCDWKKAYVRLKAGFDIDYMGAQ